MSEFFEEQAGGLGSFADSWLVCGQRDCFALWKGCYMKFVCLTVEGCRPCGFNRGVVAGSGTVFFLYKKNINFFLNLCFDHINSVVFNVKVTWIQC